MNPSRDNDPTILCMLSGGIDSAGAIHALVSREKYADYELHVHHIHIVNRENRANAEAPAVNRILDYYRNYYGLNFVFTESTVNTTGFAPMRSNRFPFDMDVCAFVEANIAAAHGNIQMVVRGRTKTDLEVTTDEYANRIERTHVVLKAALEGDDVFVPEYEFPVLDLTKEEIWNMLPVPVRKATWWCRVPIYGNGEPRACGKCSTCKDVAEFL